MTIRKIQEIAFKLHALFFVAFGMILTASISNGCGHIPPMIPKVVHMAAEDCVELLKDGGNKDIQKICATVDDLAPLFDLIAAQQRKRLAAKQQHDAGLEPLPAEGGDR